MSNRSLRSNNTKSGEIKRSKISSSKRSDLKFPVSRIHRYLRKGRYGKRISMKASVYLTAVIEYLTSEILELSGNICIDSNVRTRIEPKDINFAIELDPEFRIFLTNLTIPHSEKILYVQPALIGPKILKGMKVCIDRLDGI